MLCRVQLPFNAVAALCPFSMSLLAPQIVALLQRVERAGGYSATRMSDNVWTAVARQCCCTPVSEELLRTNADYG
jgi:hypothetical protein